MFFKEEDIAEELVCTICCSKLNDPRILPCGQTHCHTCIKSLIINEHFQCPHCDSIYREPDQVGFPVNLVVANLIKKNAKAIYRNEHVEKLSKNLDTIQNEIIDLENLDK